MPKVMQEQKLLCALALNHPDFAAYATQLPPAMEAGSPALPPAIAQDVITVLRNDPETALAIDRLRNTPDGITKYSLTGGTVTVAMVVFLLRSHVRIHRRDNGTWEFFIESKPTEGSPMADTFKRILDWFKDSGLFS